MSEIKIIPIHTSDRGLYKTCRRRWVWGSHLNFGLEPVTRASPLFFGEAVHFALKEFHGPRNFDTIQKAFLGFCDLAADAYPDRLPDDYDELRVLGVGMMDHYMRWLERREPLQTHMVDGRPQVEVTFEIDITNHLDPVVLDALREIHECEVQVLYRGTFDRISIDPTTGILYIVEYKTAKVMSQQHLMTDPQVSSYMWAASCVYDLPVGGVIYQQHRKVTPKPARILKNGTVSTAANQQTTHAIYRDALIGVYGSVQRSSQKHVNLLNSLAALESWDRDNYIVRTRVYRNEHQLSVEGARILLEVNEMLAPHTPMYPHQSLHCSMCPFMSPCTSMDDGSDFEEELQDTTCYVRRTKASNEWELLGSEFLGGILYHTEARIQHGRTGQSERSSTITTTDTTDTTDTSESDSDNAFSEFL